MKIDSRVTILGDCDGVTITIKDRTSNTDFVEVKLTPEQFCQAALGRLMITECEGRVRNLDHVGLKHENKSHEFEIPENLSYGEERKEIVRKLSIETCPEGWQPDNYFESQNSFFKKDGKEYARCTIRRWV